MKLLAAIRQALPNTDVNTAPPKNKLKLLYSQQIQYETKEEVVYRKNGKTIDRITEFDMNTGSKLKTTHYDYFNDKKIRSIDEFDTKTGKKIRTINYVLYKSIDEYDIQTGKKLRTINYNIKDDTKISSIQEYDQETGKIVTIFIYKKDGETISLIKRIDPVTEEVIKWINNKKTTIKSIEKPAVKNLQSSKPKTADKKVLKPQPAKVQKPLKDSTVQPVKTLKQKICTPAKPAVQTRVYNNVKNYNNTVTAKKPKNDDIASLIDSLYNKNVTFDEI